MGLSKLNVVTPADRKFSSGDWNDAVQYYDQQSSPPFWHPFNDLGLEYYDATVFRLSMAAASISEVIVSTVKSKPNPNLKSEFIYSFIQINETQ